MFALRQRLLGPAVTLAKRSFRSNASCLSLATELPSPLIVESPPQSSSCNQSLVEDSSALKNSLLTFTNLSAFGLASNWFLSTFSGSNINNFWKEDGLLLISTLKRRRKMMNKHKLRKRRKKNRMKNKK